MNIQSYYYGIRCKDHITLDGYRLPCWLSEFIDDKHLSLCSRALPSLTYEDFESAKLDLEEFKRLFPKQSDGAKIVLIGINYNI